MSQSDPTQAFTLSDQTLHCIVHGQTSKLARTRWSCSGAGQVVRPNSQVQAGADSGGVFYRIRSYCRWAVASLPAKVCCLRGQLPRVVVGPASADTLVRPTKTEFAANTGTRVAQHQQTRSANVRRCTTAGRGQRTGGLQQQLGPALQQRATSCHLRQQTTSGPAADSCRLIVAGEYLRAPGEQTLPRACVVIQGKCGHVEFEQEAGDHVQQSRNARRGLLALLLCCTPGLLACDTLALHT